jgi:hypothetical protein
MTIKTFTPLADSRAPAMKRSRGLRGRSMAALCLIGVLGAAACSDSEEGSTDGERAVRSNTPAESGSGTTTPRRDTADEATTPSRNPEGVDSDDINAIEDQDEDEIDGISGGGRRGGGSSSGGGRRSNADDDEDTTDAGVEDGGVVDEDGGVVDVDAGGEVEVDAGGDVEVDAGGDAG